MPFSYVRRSNRRTKRSEIRTRGLAEELRELTGLLNQLCTLSGGQEVDWKVLNPGSTITRPAERMRPVEYGFRGCRQGRFWQGTQ